MTESINSLLFYENFVTNGAVLAFGFTSGGTGSRYCIIDHFGMAEYRNDGLRYEDFTAF